MKVSDNNEIPKQESQGSSQPEAEIDSVLEAQDRLRKVLTDLELTPEQTRDDVVLHSSRDQEFLDDVPPHHG